MNAGLRCLVACAWGAFLALVSTGLSATPADGQAALRCGVTRFARFEPPSAGPDTLLVLDDSGFAPQQQEMRVRGALDLAPTGLDFTPDIWSWSEAVVHAWVDSLLGRWGRASDEERRFLALLAHHWLRRMPCWEDSSQVRGFERRLAFLGARWHSVPTFDVGDLCYCGSVLVGLARAPDADIWAAQAFLELLDQGWLSDCGDDYGGGGFGNELYLPVIRHGEEYLRTSGRSRLARAVALRVALAHETAWSVQAADTAECWTGPGPEEHRRAALRGYERLFHAASEPTFRAALRERIGRLRAARDTGCRVYWIDYGE
jgi:hypothetical protein